MIVLSGYQAFFDRSADQDSSPIGGTVVAGFVSTVEHWNSWEDEWNTVLKLFNVPYFHMKEFAAARGAFSGREWQIESLHSDTYRRLFISSLITTVKKWALLTVASYMDHRIYHDACTICSVENVFNPFSECGRNAVLKVRDFVRNHLHSKLPISYIFDRGDQGKGMLLDLMEKCNLPAPVFKRSRRDQNHPEKDLDDPPMIQLQAADLLAWEIRRWESDYKNGKQMRKSLRSFTQMKHIIWKECTYADIARLIRTLDIPRKCRIVKAS